MTQPQASVCSTTSTRLRDTETLVRLSQALINLTPTGRTPPTPAHPHTDVHKPELKHQFQRLYLNMKREAGSDRAEGGGSRSLGGSFTLQHRGKYQAAALNMRTHKYTHTLSDSEREQERERETLFAQFSVCCGCFNILGG